MPLAPVTATNDVNLDNLPLAVQGARQKARSWSESSGNLEGYFEGLVDIDERLNRIRARLDAPSDPEKQ